MDATGQTARGFLFYLMIVVLGSGVLSAVAWLAKRVADAGHARAVRHLRTQWRLRPAPPVWSPSLTPSLVQALDIPGLRERAIEWMDLGPPTEVRGSIREYARTIPLPSRNGKERELEIIREVWGMSSKHRWALLEDGVEVDSGFWAFYVCG